MARHSAPRLLRLIFQARYKPELSYFSLADKAASQFENDYPIWQRGVDLDIRLSDYASRCVLSISNSSFSYCQDSSHLDLATTRIGRALAELPEAMKLRGYTRLGLRHFVLVPVNMEFESLNDVMATKLFVQAQPLQEALPQRCDDLLYRIDGSEGENKFHVTIAPVRREEISGKIIDLAGPGTIDPSRLQETIKKAEENYPSVAVFFDVDMYREADQIETRSAEAFVEAAGQRIERLIQGTTDYLLRVRL